MAETYLRRYTDLPALVYLLKEQKLTLLDPQFWDDANDSHYLNLYREKKRLGSVLALCFTQTTERYHHWRVFASGSGGVCVSFKRPDLLRAVKPVQGLRSGPVEYLTLTEGRNARHKPDELPFLKRSPFQDEEEFRVIWESQEMDRTAFDIPISLSCIDKVTLSPWLHKALFKHVKDILHGIDGCQTLKIVKSTLISNEEWKKIGERVAGDRVTRPRLSDEAK